MKCNNNFAGFKIIATGVILKHESTSKETACAGRIKFLVSVFLLGSYNIQSSSTCLLHVFQHQLSWLTLHLYQHLKSLCDLFCIWGHGSVSGGTVSVCGGTVYKLRR